MAVRRGNDVFWNSQSSNPSLQDLQHSSPRRRQSSRGGVWMLSSRASTTGFATATGKQHANHGND